MMWVWLDKADFERHQEFFCIKKDLAKITRPWTTIGCEEGTIHGHLVSSCHILLYFSLVLRGRDCFAMMCLLRSALEAEWRRSWNEMDVFGASVRYGHTIKSTPHPIPNCEVKLDGPVQYWGGGPPGKFVVLYLPRSILLDFSWSPPLPLLVSVDLDPIQCCLK